MVAQLLQKTQRPLRGAVPLLGERAKASRPGPDQRHLGSDEERVDQHQHHRHRDVPGLAAQVRRLTAGSRIPDRP